LNPERPCGHRNLKPVSGVQAHGHRGRRGSAHAWDRNIKRPSLTGDGPSLQDVASPQRHRTVHRTCPSQNRGADATPSSLPVQAKLVVGLRANLRTRPPLRPRPRGRTGRRVDAIEPRPARSSRRTSRAANRSVPTPSLEGLNSQIRSSTTASSTPLSGGGDLDDLSLLLWDHRRTAHAKVRSTRYHPLLGTLTSSTWKAARSNMGSVGSDTQARTCSVAISPWSGPTVKPG